jgi:hypothetical protein
MGFRSIAARVLGFSAPRFAIDEGCCRLPEREAVDSSPRLHSIELNLHLWMR